MASRTKPVRDIRYFESTGAVLGAGAPMPRYASELVDLPKEAIALGQRIGRKCEELGVSIGSADHLYVCFTPALPAGAVRPTDYAVEPWHQFVLCGVGRGFDEQGRGEKLQAVSNATFDAIAALAQTGADRLALLQKQVADQGEALRVTLRTKATRKYRISVEQTVPVHPSPSPVIARIEEISTARVAEVQVAQVRFHDDAPSLVDRLAIVGEVLTIHPRKSFRAEQILQDFELPLRVDLRRHFGGA